MNQFNFDAMQQPTSSYSNIGYTTGPVVTTHSSTVTSDSSTNIQSSGSQSSNSSTDSTVTSTTTVTKDPLAENLKHKVSGFFGKLFGSSKDEAESKDDDLQENFYTTGPVITTHTSDVSVDSNTTSQQSGSRTGNTVSD